MFVPIQDLATNARGIARAQALALDGAALAALRASSSATLTEFPLGTDGTATVSVERFNPFTDGATAVVMEATGPRRLALPDQLYYRGQVDGDASSLVVLIAGADTVRGMVRAGGEVYRFGRDGGGVYQSWSLDDADPSVHPGPGEFCGVGGNTALLSSHPGRVALPPGIAAAPPPTSAFSPTLMAQVAIDTDQELLAKFGGDTDATLLYLADLAAAVSAVFDTDTDVRIKFSFIRLWVTPDPWTGSTTLALLDELQAYWQANEAGTPRDLAHLVSGRDGLGGIAYLDVLCDDTYGYGVSAVHGEFDAMDPDETWDITVLAHELGHNFGSVHTHCYDPPLDECYNGEADDGCYDGVESVPMGGGTIMSYCHLLSGGQANIDLTFGTTVSAVIRTVAENGICIGPPCGDGLLDPGEDCDDGNNVGGDCCGATCLAEPDGGSCDDAFVCTTGDQCASGACVGTPVVDGSPCDDGTQCTDDSCQAGACVGVPTPALGCRTPTLPLKSQLQLKDKLADKSDQVVWKWTKGQATTYAEFGSPHLSDEYELCVYDNASSLVFSGRFPAGGICHGVGCWKQIVGKGYNYKDKDRTPNGMEKLQLKSGLDGVAKIAAKGKGVLLEMPTLGSPNLPITAQLRGAGICWEATYSTVLVSTTEQFKAKSD